MKSTPDVGYLAKHCGKGGIENELDLISICKLENQLHFTVKRNLVVLILDESESVLLIWNLTPEMMVFVDKTESDKRDSMRKFGYSLRGQCATSIRLLCRGKSVAALDTNGLFASTAQHTP